MSQTATVEFDIPVRRRAAILWNLIFSYGSLVVVLVRNIGLIPLFVRYVDQEEYGGWMASGGILVALTQMDFGLLGVVTQQTAVAFGNKDRDRLARVAGTGVACAFVICLLLFLVIGALAPFVPRSVGLHGDQAVRVAWCFLIVAGANSVQLLGFLAGNVLRSLQRPLGPGLMRMLSESTALGITAYTITHGWGIYAIAAGLAARSLIELFGNVALFLWVLIQRLNVRPRADRSFVKELLTLSSFQFLTQMARALKLGIDPYLVGYFMGPTSALIFSLTSKAGETVRLLLSQLTGSVVPALSHLHGEGDRPRYRAAVIALLRIQCAAAAIAFGGVIAFNPSFMRLWLAHSQHADGVPVEQLYGGHLLSALIGIWCYGTVAAGVSHDALFTMGRFLRLSWYTWLEQIVRLPLMVVLLALHYMWGAPAMSLLAQIWTLNWLQNASVFRALELTRSENCRVAWMHLKHLVVPILLTAVVLCLPPAQSWVALAAWAAAYCLVCGGASLALDPELLQLVRRRGRLS